jgi:hypothetical protein
MKKFLTAFAVIATLSSPALAQAPAPAAPATASYTVATATVGDYLDHPALKTIFIKYLPDLASNPRIEEGRALTLPDLVQYVPGQVTPDKLAAIDAELKALPPQ